MYRVTVTRITTVQAHFSFGYMPVQTEEIVYVQEYAESERASAMADFMRASDIKANNYVTLEWIA